MYNGNLYILWIYHNGSLLEPQVFESEGEDPKDHQKDLTIALNKAIQEWNDKGVHTSVSMIYGKSLEPLRKYFEAKR